MQSKPSKSFAHVHGVSVETDPANIKSLTITISDSTGKTLATIDDITPGSTCGIDHDFPPGDYMIESSDGNGTQFTSFSDRTLASTDTTGSTKTSAVAAPTGLGGHGTLSFDGKTYDFTNGRCSPTLDPNQFLFRDPPNPGNDSTYFALTVTDLTATSSNGGNHPSSITYQKDGKTIVAASDATLEIRDDLSGGTFSGVDFITSKQASGSYTC